ncbi:translocon-associated protein subunit alpha-like protein [Tanacetum coccineum]
MPWDSLKPQQNRFSYSQQAFELVNDAWVVLSNPMRKSIYDSELNHYMPHQHQQHHQVNSLGFDIEVENEVENGFACSDSETLDLELMFRSDVNMLKKTRPQQYNPLTAAIVSAVCQANDHGFGGLGGFSALDLYEYFEQLDHFLMVKHGCHGQSDSDDAELVAETVEEGNLGIVDDEVQDFGIGNYSPAPGVETVCVFPKNAAKRDQHVKVIAVHASVHLPFDHRMLVQNLSSVTFNNAPVPPSVQATFPYIFAVSKFLQACTFDLVEQFFL